MSQVYTKRQCQRWGDASCTALIDINEVAENGFVA